ncbi:MAG TPA: metallophosphoesterase family protein [Candidatus Bathyarchaeia archaeon]
MRTVVLSDIHANMAALRRVLADLPSYDEFYCLGDIVGYGPDPNAVVEALRTLRPTIVLAGNHDYAVVTGNPSGFVDYAVKAIQWTRSQLSKNNLDYLQALAASARHRVQGIEIAMFHGSPRDPFNEYVFPGTQPSLLKRLLELSKARLLLQGHTHVPMSFRDGDALLLNPGSVGQPRDGDPRASYIVLEMEMTKMAHKVRRVQYEIDRTAKAILDNGLPSFLAERLSLGV